MALDYRSKVISKMSSKMCQTQQNKEYYWTLLKEIKELSNSLSEVSTACNDSDMCARGELWNRFFFNLIMSTRAGLQYSVLYLVPFTLLTIKKSLIP